ncbi:MAG: GxxExxY protein [Candidatus Falkowbacteria bacterium]
MKEDKILYKDLSYKIVGVLFEVYNKLGYGYKEKYYEKR